MNLVASVLAGLIIGLAPFALGSNRPLPWSYNALLIGVLMLLVAVAVLTAGRRQPDLKLGLIGWPAGLFAVALAWAMLQMVPGGIGLAHPVWAVAAEALDQDVSGHITVNPDHTGWGVLRWATALGGFVALFVLARTPGSARVMFWIVAGFALLGALYGLARVSLSLDTLLWYRMDDSGSLSAGFVNRNNAATYFAMMATASYAAVIDLVRRSIRKAQESSNLSLPEAIVQAVTGVPGLALLVFVTLTVACMTTASRGGILAMLAGLCVVTLLYSLRSRTAGGRSGLLGIVISGAALVAVLLQVAGGRLSERLASDGTSGLDGRLDVFSNTLVAIRDYIVTGSGLSTFQDVYPAYRSDVSNVGEIWDKAHNDYLELVLDLGLPAALLIALAALVMLVKLTSGFFRRHRDTYFTAAAVGALAVVGVHSLVDFSLQMQANALTLALLMACGAAQADSSRS